MSSPQPGAVRGVTRALVLADAPVLRRGLIGMVDETAGLQAVGSPGEPRRALTLAETARPDAVIVEAPVHTAPGPDRPQGRTRPGRTGPARPVLPAATSRSPFPRGPARGPLLPDGLLHASRRAAPDVGHPT